MSVGQCSFALSYQMSVEQAQKNLNISGNFQTPPQDMISRQKGGACWEKEDV